MAYYNSQQQYQDPAQAGFNGYAPYEIDVILHIDVDSFECQVHSKNLPYLHGKPFAVSNGGRIVSISQEAKRLGACKDLEHENTMRSHFPNVIILPVPEHPRWEKPDSSIARRASFAIRDQIINYQNEKGGMVVNYSSIDEFFVDCSELVSQKMNGGYYPNFGDLAPNTVLEDNNALYGNELHRVLYQQRFGLTKSRLVVGAIIGNEIASKIKRTTGYTVSVGISSNMRLAKMASPLNKPNGYTILTSEGLLERLAYEMYVRDVPGLKKSRGAQFCQIFGENLTVAEALRIRFRAIRNHFGQAEAQEIYNTLHGLDDGTVIQKCFNDNVGASKSFRWPGFQDVSPSMTIGKQVEYLGEEIMNRLKYEEYNLHKRKTNKLRIEVTFQSGRNRTSKCSHTFDIDENYEYISPGDRIEVLGSVVADCAVNGLEEEVGFVLHEHRILKIKLVACSFDNVDFNVQDFVINWLMEKDDSDSE